MFNIHSVASGSTQVLDVYTSRIGENCSGVGIVASFTLVPANPVSDCLESFGGPWTLGLGPCYGLTLTTNNGL